MICRKCGTEFDGKKDLCHRCRSIYAYEGLPPRDVKKEAPEKPPETKKAPPKAAAKKK